jgi:hypothetical protein
MTEMTAVVRRPKLREMVALRRLFIEAVGGHFGYYPAEYREMILDQNRLHHLTVAHLHPHRPLYVASQNGRLTVRPAMFTGFTSIRLAGDKI